ncbi:hypothetical protein GCM10026982_62460 [Nocardiopsis aegyptia]
MTLLPICKMICVRRSISNTLVYRHMYIYHYIPPKMPLSKFLLNIFVDELAAEKKLSLVIPARATV